MKHLFLFIFFLFPLTNLRADPIDDQAHQFCKNGSLSLGQLEESGDALCKNAACVRKIKKGEEGTARRICVAKSIMKDSSAIDEKALHFCKDGSLSLGKMEENGDTYCKDAACVRQGKKGEEGTARRICVAKSSRNDADRCEVVDDVLVMHQDCKCYDACKPRREIWGLFGKKVAGLERAECRDCIKLTLDGINADDRANIPDKDRPTPSGTGQKSSTGATKQ